MHLRVFLFLTSLLLTSILWSSVSPALSASPATSRQHPDPANVLLEKEGVRARKLSLSPQGPVRRYLLYAPHTPSPLTPLPADLQQAPRPLVLVFHGYLGSGRQMMQITELNALARQHNFIVAYPDVARDRWQAAMSPTDQDDSDLQFVDALLDDIASQYAIDSKRVYATGFSNGGFFTHRLACERSDRIAAIAPVAATMGKSLMARCQPTRPVPVLMINGTHDPIVTWQGELHRVRYAFRNAQIASVPETVRFWREQYACTETPLTTLQLHTAQHKQGIQRDQYLNCQPPGQVHQLTIHHGGHVWPITRPLTMLQRVILGPLPPLEISGSNLIWEFFAENPIPAEAP